MGSVFHVDCPFSGRNVCCCEYGTRPELREPSAAQEYYQQAVAAWEAWQAPDAARGMFEPVEVLVPRLLKRVRVVPVPRVEGALQGAGSADLRAAQSLGLSTGSRETATVQTDAGMAARLLGLQGPFAAHASGTLTSHPLSTPTASTNSLAATPLLRSEAPFAASVTTPPLLTLDDPLMLLQQQQQGQARTSSWLARSSPRQLAAVGATAAAGGALPPLEPRPSPPTVMAMPEGYAMRGPSTRDPPQAWRLRVRDVTPALVGKMVQLYWPADKQWWPARVVDFSSSPLSALLLYETGEVEAAALGGLLESGDVAWLLAEDVPGAAAASNDGKSGGGRTPRTTSKRGYKSRGGG